MLTPTCCEPNFGSINGMDPRADWLLGPCSDFLADPEALIPFILSFHDAVGPTMVKMLLQQESGPPIYISPRYFEQSEEGGFHILNVDKSVGRSVVAWAPRNFFCDLVGNEKYAGLRDAEKRIRLGTPVAGAEPKWKPGQKIPAPDKLELGPPDGGWPDTTVIVAIIDDGIAVANERFRRSDGKTRVECFWRMREKISGTIDFGLELFKRDRAGVDGIDTLLVKSRVDGRVPDEDLLYRTAGVYDFVAPFHNGVAWRAAHGTHVLDVATGADPRQRDVADRPIIAVQLPTVVTENTSGSDLTWSVLEGLSYIFDRARKLTGKGKKKKLPLIINFSYGVIAGPHDGTSELEMEIEKLAEDYEKTYGVPCRVVLPAGNSHLSRCHAEVCFNGEHVRRPLYLRLQPDDLTDSSLQIWLPYDGDYKTRPSRLMVRVQAPDGAITDELGEDTKQVVRLCNDHGVPICELRYVFDANTTKRGWFLVTFRPTARQLPSDDPCCDHAVAPAGRWTIWLRNLRLADEAVHAWIQRDDTAYGYRRRGRQAYFDHAEYVRFDCQGRVIEDDDHPEQGACVITRASLFNALATGPTVLTAGGFRRQTFKLAPYSAGEPIMPTCGVPPDPLKYRKPDVCMVTDDSKVHAGILATGTHSGSIVAFDGTSVAAPQLVREIADRMAKRLPSDRLALKEIAEDEETRCPERPEVPKRRSGWGRLNRPSPVALARHWSEPEPRDPP